MICVAAYFYHLAFQFVADAAEVAVEFVYDFNVYEMLPFFGAEDDVEVVLD